MGWWAIGLLLIGYVLFVERKGWQSLGIRPPATSTLLTAAIGFTLALFGVAAFGVITLLLGADTSATEARLDQSASAPLWWIVAVFIRAGVVEELIFRGFVLSRAVECGAPNWLALTVFTGLFVLPHAFFWPSVSLIMVAFISLAMGVIFLWKRDLLACILAHIAVNVGGVVASLLQ